MGTHDAALPGVGPRVAANLVNYADIPAENNAKECPAGWRTFSSPPYVVTHLMPGVVSLVVLSAKFPLTEHLLALDRNVEMTRLPATLVWDKRSLWTKEPWREINTTPDIPAARLWQVQGLPNTYKAIDSSERRRWCGINESDYSFSESELGDLSTLTDGRNATQEDVERLGGLGEDGVPKGLVRCPECKEFNGECLKTGADGTDRVVYVYCRCRNDNRSPVDGSRLDERMLAAHYFDEASHRILYKPATDAVFKFQRERLAKMTFETIQ
jgi:hypothetical protein